MEVVGDGVLVDLRDAPLLGTQHAGEVAEVVDGERQVGRQGLPDGLAVLPALDHSEVLEVLLDAIRDPEQDVRALGGTGLAPRLSRRVGGVECEVDVIGV